MSSPEPVWIRKHAKAIGPPGWVSSRAQAGFFSAT
jgi:hypothetical protein